MVSDKSHRLGKANPVVTVNFTVSWHMQSLCAKCYQFSEIFEITQCCQSSAEGK